MTKLYHAIIFDRSHPDRPGQRITVFAKGPLEAKKELEEKHGIGNVINVHNKEDSERPR